ncbi:2-oxoglutarate receptor 1-like [Xenia sp. Carnegie-2017]|uniref:2-oxoglutarate receptor 1-like n=1 Tax=Xenia sp. Carnegie-2017 TaxID=2897299 RepID=UPI001F04FB17|nr:2-oxoglutarate receptor 1-like [Xenia sp. Carnegie-2017]
MKMKSLNLVLLFIGVTLISGSSMPTNATNSKFPTHKNNSDLANGTNTSTTSKGGFLLSRQQRKNLVIIIISVAVIGALLNIAVILAIVFDPLRILRKGPWITILNLAIADFLWCVTCFFQWLDYYEFNIINFTGSERLLYEDIVQFGWSFSNGASFLFLTFFSMQIFVLTKHPLKSRFMFTTPKVLSACIGLWLLSIPVGFCYIIHRFPPFDKHFRKFWMARIAFLHFLTLVQLILNIQVTIQIIRSGRNTKDDCRHNNKHRNMAKTVVILTAIFFITTFPFRTLRQIEFVLRMNNTKIGNLDEVAYLFYPLLLMNFVANPIMYSLRHSDYRRTFLAFLGKIRGKNVHIPKTTANTSFKLTQRSSINSDRYQSGKTKHMLTERLPLHHTNRF